MRSITRPVCLIVALGVAVIAVLAGCGATSSTTGSNTGSDTTDSGGTTVDAARCGNGEATTASSSGIAGVPDPNEDLSDYGQTEEGGCLYEGPGDFSIDVSQCPANWDINQGITDTSIKVFTSSPHSGALAAYGGIEDGAKSYFDYINENGGIDGRKIEYTIMDDQYQSDITAQNVNKAIQSGKYAASFAVFGTANNLAIRDAMNQKCEGQYMVASSDVQFFDPQQYPWTTGFGLNRYNETEMWAQFLEEKFSDGAKVVMITMQGDLGESYSAGFTRATEGSNIEIIGDETFSPTAPSITDQVTTAAATKADVVVLNVAGTFCTQALEEIEKSSWEPTIVEDNACSQISTTYAPLLEAGATGNGSNTIRYYVVPTEAGSEDQEYVDLFNETLEAQGLDPANAQFANGWWWAWDFVQVLQDAARLQGGLNRANINIAAHSYTSEWPLLMEGVVGELEGVEKAFPYQAGQMFEYTGATSKEVGEFVSVGPLMDNPGDIKNYLQAQEAG